MVRLIPKTTEISSKDGKQMIIECYFIRLLVKKETETEKKEEEREIERKRDKEREREREANNVTFDDHLFSVF